MLTSALARPVRRLSLVLLSLVTSCTAGIVDKTLIQCRTLTPLSVSKSVLAVSAAQIVVNGTSTVTLTLKDESGEPYLCRVDTIEFETTTGTSEGTLATGITEVGEGIYTSVFTGTALGSPLTISAEIDGKALESALPTVEVVDALDLNQAPVVSGQSVSVDDDETVAITLTATDADADALTYTVTDPSHGTLSGTAPNLIYTPTAPYSGADSFTLTVNDGTVDSGTATVVISVTHINHAPATPTTLSCVTAPVAASTGNACTLTAASPTDSDGDAVTYVDGGSTCGTVVVNSATGNATFTAPAKAATCVVKVKAFDSSLMSSAVTSATITAVNQAPVATNQSITVTEALKKAITLAGTDGDGDTLTYTIVSGPSHGTLSVVNGTRYYTSNNPYTGSDSFTFRVNDGTANSAANGTVTLTVEAPILYLDPDGDDSSGRIGEADYPFGTAQGAYAAASTFATSKSLDVIFHVNVGDYVGSPGTELEFAL